MLHRPSVKSADLALGSILCVIALVSIQSCKHEPPIRPHIEETGSTSTVNTWEPPPDTMSIVTCDPDTVYFAQSVGPLLASYCAGTSCHNNTSHRGNVRLYDYAHDRSEVVPGNPNGSALIQVIQSTGNGHMPPSNHLQLTADQVTLLRTWIQQGALNNSCVPTLCDTMNVTYSATIVPILNTFCTGCHAGASPSGGLDLTNYAAVHATAVEGSLEGSIQHITGYYSMPPTGGGLSPCRIEQILNWIAQGSPNN